jgi:hypothetical protein
LAAAAGFPYVVLWDTTGADTGPRPTVAGVVRDATAGKPGSIVLLHAGPAVTPRALPAIIARYRARGFGFVTLPELLGVPSLGTRAGAEAAGVSSEWRPRSVDRPGDEIAGDSDDVRSSVDARDAAPEAVGPPPALPVDDQAPPVRPDPGSERQPPAREAAWARRDGTPASIAVFTVGLLAILLAVSVVAGRPRRAEDVADP